MISAIPSVTQAQSPAKTSAPSPRPAPPKPPSSRAPATDTVQLSNAALAIQESIETPAQTAKEASSGDRQAQRLLAREAAAKKVG